MKKYILGSAFLLVVLVMPVSQAQATGLTTQQATTLIQVVQASPGTPASAFVSLITAFSDLNTAQASSLISVVQSSPGTSASVFVPLITSFSSGVSNNQPSSNNAPATQTTTANNGTNVANPMSISWSGGNGNVQIGLVDSRFESGTILGWIQTTNNPSGSLSWGQDSQGGGVTDLAGTVTWSVANLSQGPFRIIGVTSNSHGNYCAGSSVAGECNYVLSNSYSLSNRPSNITLPTFAPISASVSAPVTAPVITVNPSSASIAYGGTVSFSWSVTPTTGTTCAAAGNGIGGTTGSSASALSGGPWTTPALYTSTTYGMVCNNSAGTTYKYVSVTVAPQTSTIAAPTPTATINPNALAYDNISIPMSGTAANVSTLYVAAVLDSSGYTQSSLIVYPTGGSWSSAFASLPAGTYTIKAYANNANGTLLATRALTVTASATTAPAPAPAPVTVAAPTVITSAASGITSTSVTLNGSINPNGDSGTTGWFRGDVTNPGSCNDTFGYRFPSSGNAFSPTYGTGYYSAYSQTVPGLTPNTTYYYCAIANNSAGTSYGSIVSVSTSVASAARTSQTASALNAVESVVSASSSSEGSATFSYVWNHDLQVGSQFTEDIRALQMALALQGLYFGDVTGGFYNQTFAAVKAFQQKYGIDQTGFVGSITRAKLNELY